MSTLRSRHNQAMELAELGFLARQRGDVSVAQQYFAQALVLERQVAQALGKRPGFELSRAVSYRSAATLALHSNDPQEASRLAHIGLASDPPVEIAAELWDIVHQLNWERHLQLRGVELLPQELQVAIDGAAVGPGIVRGDLAVRRVDSASRLLYRTGLRTRGVKLQDAVRQKQAAKDSLEVYWSVPRNNCFAITLRLGKQLTLAPIGDQSDVVEEFLDCVELFNQGKSDELLDRIGDKDYYDNFAGLASEIAPDGKNVNFVGFTAVRDGKQKTAVMNKPARDIHVVPKLNTKEKMKAPNAKADIDTVRIAGELKMGDKRQQKAQRISLVDAFGVSHSLVVPLGLIDDVVPRNWGRVVEAEARREKSGRLVLLRLLE